MVRRAGLPRLAALALAAVGAGVTAWLIAGTAGCRGGNPGIAATAVGEDVERVPVDVIVAARGDITETVEVTGTIEALAEVSLGASVSERISYLAGREGDRVSAGQVAIRLETADLDASLAQASAQVDAAKVRLAQAEEGHSYKGISTQNQIETAARQLETARVRLRQAETSADLAERRTADGIAAAETQVEQARARLEQARSGLAQTEGSTEAAVTAARAAVASAQAAYDDLKRGARTQQREQAREQVRQAEAQVHAAELQVENARTDLQRMVSLRDAGAVSTQTVDGARLRYDTAVDQLRVAQSQLESARQGLSLVQEGPTEEQLRIAAQQIEQARANLATAEAAREQVKQREQDVRTAEQAVTAAEIARSDARSQLLNVDTARAEVEAARKLVESAEIAYEQAKAGEITVSVDEKEIAAARAALRAAQAMVDIYSAQRAKRVIVCPVDGTIARRHAEIGEIAPMGGPILTIVTDDALQFAATVSELDVSRIEIGRPVDVTVDGLPGRVITGHVIAVLPAAQVSSRSFTVKVSVPANAGAKPGMFARGEIRLRQTTGAVVVPKDVLIERQGGYIAYLEENGTAKRRQLTLGLEGVAVVEVVEGINEGDRVVLHGKENLSDGAAVEATEIDPPRPANNTAGQERVGLQAAEAASD